MKPVIGIFDFDGTLLRGDSLLRYIGFKTRRSPWIVLYYPLIVGIYLLYKASVLSGTRAKATVLQLLGIPRQEEAFKAESEAFVRTLIGRENPTVTEHLRRNAANGGQTILLSATLGEWLRAWCRLSGVEATILATEVEIQNGRLTGRFATPNCHKAEKLRRLEQAVPHYRRATTLGFGNSKADEHYLRRMTYAYYKDFSRPDPRLSTSAAGKSHEGRGDNPKARPAELWIWGICLFVLYALLAAGSLTSGAQTPIPGQTGSYLGFDNFSRFDAGGGIWDLSHPLFLLTSVFNGRVLVPLLGRVAAARMLNILLMTLLTAGAHLLLYATLRRMGRSVTEASALLLPLVFTFIPLVLPFTIETYPYTYFLLSLSLYLILGVNKPSGRAATVTAWLLGAVTLTNIAKPLSALLLCRPAEKRVQRLRYVLRVAVPFSVLFGALFLFYHYRGQTSGHPENAPWQVAREQTFSFRSYRASNVAHFLLQPIAPAGLTEQTLGDESVLRPTPYLPGPFYPNVLALCAGIVLLLSAVWGVAVSRRSLWRNTIAAYFAVDIAVHWIGGYGMSEAIIFGGHWLPLLPLAWALLAERYAVRGTKLLAVGIAAAVLLGLLNLQTLSQTILSPEFFSLLR